MKKYKIHTLALILIFLQETSYSQLYNRSSKYYGMGINYISANQKAFHNPQIGLSFTKSIFYGNRIDAIISYQKNNYKKNIELNEKSYNIILGIGWVIDLRNVHVASFENKHHQCVKLTIRPFTGIYYMQNITNNTKNININPGVKLFLRKSGMGKKDNMFEKSISISALIEKQKDNIHFGFKIGLDIYKYK
jgi:hypothetical protein